MRRPIDWPVLSPGCADIQPRHPGQLRARPTPDSTPRRVGELLLARPLREGPVGWAVS